MSNYPDDMNWDAFERAYRDAPTFDANARAAQAMVSLASMAGMDWGAAGDWLNDETYHLDDDDREYLASLFDSRLDACLDEIRDHVTAYRAKLLRDAAKRAVVGFIASLGMVRP